MNKNLHGVYLTGISLFLFLHLLEIEKGFDLQRFLKSVPGLIVLILLLTGTFFEMWFNSNKKKTINEEHSDSKKYGVKKQFIETFLSQIINKENENVSINSVLTDFHINVDILTKNLGQINAAEMTAELRKQIESGLEEHFGFKNEFEINIKIKSNEVENDEVKTDIEIKTDIAEKPIEKIKTNIKEIKTDNEVKEKNEESTNEVKDKVEYKPAEVEEVVIETKIDDKKITTENIQRE